MKLTLKSLVCRFVLGTVAAIPLTIANSVTGADPLAKPISAADYGYAWKADEISGCCAQGTGAWHVTPPWWSVDGRYSGDAMFEFVTIYDRTGYVGAPWDWSIEGGYMSGTRPDGTWTSGLLPIIALEAINYWNFGSFLSANKNTWMAVHRGGYGCSPSLGQVQVGSYWASFSDCVSNATNLQQGEIRGYSTATWLGSGNNPGNTYYMYWSPNSVNWYKWGGSNGWADSPYWANGCGNCNWTQNGGPR